MDGKKKFLIMGAAAIVIAELLFAVILKPTPLPEYKEPEPEPEPEVVYDTVLFQIDNMHIEVPDKWQEVNLGTYVSYIDPATASAIEVEKTTYYPTINTANEDSLRAELSVSGKKLILFERINNSIYKMGYTADNIAVIEFVCWDFNYVYRIRGKYSPEKHDEVYDLIEHCLYSFGWEGNKIPDGYHISYYEFGNFAMLLKDTWGIGESADTLSITDPETGMFISVSVCVSADDFSTVTQTDYTNYTMSGKEGYIQNSFNNTGNAMSSNATYYLNGQMVVFNEIYLATGVYQFKITAEYYAETEEQSIESYRAFINNFVYY